MNYRDVMNTHSVRQCDALAAEERWREHLARVGWWFLTVAGAIGIVWAVLGLSGCGGGSTDRAAQVVPAPPPVVVTPPPVAPPPPPPPSQPPAPTPGPGPVTLPASYTLQVLLPLPGGSSAQAEAINGAGQVVGWSVMNGQAQATIWEGGQALWLGEGWALAINAPPEANGMPVAPQVVGYRDVGGMPIAELWPDGGLTRDAGQDLGTLPGYDSSEALGVDDDGTVVGMAFVFSNPSIQQGWEWTPAGGMVAIQGMAEALAIHKGQIVGFAQDGQAEVAGQELQGVQGAATAVSDAGAAGFTFGTEDGFAWLGGTLTLLPTPGGASLASGINQAGVIVGQQGVGPAGSIRLAPRGARARLARAVGVTRAMAWTPTDGMVDLNGRIDPSDAATWTLAFATGVSDAGIVVGAAVSNNGTAETVGFMLEAQP